jgi:hypothetical protein
MKRLLCTAGLAAAISLMLASSALATTVIDTTPSWNGSYSVTPFGYNYGGGAATATYGQTITVATSDTHLDSFTFYMSLPNALLFRGEVYLWNPNTGTATGSALYESAATHTTISGFQPITFTPGVTLSQGSQYVLFASISRDYAADAGKGSGPWGAVQSQVYTGGHMVFLNNGSNISQWTGIQWSTGSCCGVGDLAFKASLSGAAPPDADLSIASVNNITVDATGSTGATVTYNTPAAKDEDNPVTATVTCDHASGSTFGFGDTKVTCTATDTDDTNGSVTTSFIVHVRTLDEMAANLATLVKDMGSGTSLGDKVALMQLDLAGTSRSPQRTFCTDTAAFINAVQAETPKKLSSADAQTLVTAAQNLEAVYGC